VAWQRCAFAEAAAYSQGRGCPCRLWLCAGLLLFRTEPKAMKGSRGRTLRFLANVDPIDVVSADTAVARGEGGMHSLVVVCVLTES
jgi:hypothetical protein